MSKKHKYTDPDLPVYEIYIDEEENQGIRFISLVASPATESIGVAFDKQEDLMLFKKLDQQKIFGYFMIPDKLIFRRDDVKGDYYVKFSSDTIKKMMLKFNKFNNNKSLNVDHTSDRAPGFIAENWITEDDYYDKSKLYGIDPVVGGWCGIVQIEDAKFWKEKVKEEGRYSFSIEGLMSQQSVNHSYNKHFERISNIEELIDWLSDDDIKYILKDL
jgi:hypothetical protein